MSVTKEKGKMGKIGEKKMNREEKGYLTFDEMAEYLNLGPTHTKNLFKARGDEMLAATLVHKAERILRKVRKRRKKKG